MFCSITSSAAFGTNKGIEVSYPILMSAFFAVGSGSITMNEPFVLA